MTPTDFQVEVGALLMGSGTGYEIDEDGIEGLDLPKLRVSDVPRAVDHGERVGRDLLEGRTIAFNVNVLATTSVEMSEKLDALSAACTVKSREGEISWAVPGQSPRVIFARNRRRTVLENRRTRLSLAAEVALEFHATDPRIYSSEQFSAEAPLPISNIGAPWPFSWPVSWGSTSGSGTVQVTNNGTFETPWLGQIQAATGFVSGPRIENVTTGQVLDFTSLVLQPGQFLSLDAYERTALLNGEASRYGTLSTGSRWFFLQPGVNELRARAKAAPEGSTFTMTYRSAYL